MVKRYIFFVYNAISVVSFINFINSSLILQALTSTNAEFENASRILKELKLALQCISWLVCFVFFHVIQKLVRIMCFKHCGCRFL